MNSVVENKIDYFYGIYKNDSIRFIKSDQILLNQSCYGKILDEIMSTSSNVDTRTEKDQIFKFNSFHNLVTNKPLSLNESNSKKIILVFSVRYGSLRNKDFQEITKLISTHQDFELKIISVDQFR